MDCLNISIENMCFELLKRKADLLCIVFSLDTSTFILMKMVNEPRQAILCLRAFRHDKF